MAITDLNPNKNLLERLKEGKIDVRISYHGDKNSPYFGKIHEIMKQDISLLPYLVYEPVPTPNTDKFLNRYRIETEYPKILPIMNILPEPLSNSYIAQFVKLQNYFNSLVISDKELRNNLFDKDIYFMPSEEEIKYLEKSLFKTQLILPKMQPKSRG